VSLSENGVTLWESFREWIENLVSTPILASREQDGCRLGCKIVDIELPCLFTLPTSNC
jgi:hypothetical protein